MLILHFGSLILNIDFDVKSKRNYFILLLSLTKSIGKILKMLAIVYTSFHFVILLLHNIYHTKSDNSLKLIFAFTLGLVLQNVYIYI